MCLHLLPRYLGMHMPAETPGPPQAARRRSSLGLMVKADEYMLWKARTELLFEKQKERDGLMKTVLEKIGECPRGVGTSPQGWVTCRVLTAACCAGSAACRTWPGEQQCPGLLPEPGGGRP